MCLVIFNWMLDIYSGHEWCSLLAKRIHPAFSWEDLSYPPSGRVEADHLSLIRNWSWFAVFIRLGYFWLSPLPNWEPWCLFLPQSILNSKNNIPQHHSLLKVKLSYISLSFSLIKESSNTLKGKQVQGVDMLLSAFLLLQLLDPQVLIGPLSPW